MLKGIDVSVYQGDINYDLLKTEVDFVIIKATEGNGYTDPKFARNKAETQRVGLPHGYYHFARPNLGNSPEAEADYFLSVCQPEPNTILFLDYEVNYKDPVGWCKAWLDHLSTRLNGYKPLVYLNLSLVRGSDWTSLISADYGLWLADYDNDPNLIATPWQTLAFKQFTSSSQIGGINGNVDANVFYGDSSALGSYGLKPASAPTPPISTQTVSLNEVLLNNYRSFIGADPHQDEINYKIQEMAGGKPLSSVNEDIMRGDTRFNERWIKPAVEAYVQTHPCPEVTTQTNATPMPVIFIPPTNPPTGFLAWLRRFFG